eukprot:TRINITY_DN21965_c0_g1_i2.p1 TRINITY_DN21965_c0_g1~~TRINITY_DN21965_c0_g1_i2.p1  ORF type:complete len:190 (+),score=26.00 TRINITY_DN21965_c0_g1_i2:66-635(+)
MCIRDRYMGMREISTKRDFHMMKVCFICNLEKGEIEMNGEDFEEHRQYHSIWSYLCLFNNLRKVSEKDLNGEEIYIRRKISEKPTNISFFPLHRSHKYKKDDEEPEYVQRLQGQLETMEKKLIQVEKEVGEVGLLRGEMNLFKNEILKSMDSLTSHYAESRNQGNVITLRSPERKRHKWGTNNIVPSQQ